uniref:Uncharacterized protein n=1 Tax=viral metagenome TaxID=1070528 RepID=A0A6C0EH46_9ZZZZ
MFFSTSNLGTKWKKKNIQKTYQNFTVRNVTLDAV